MLAHQDEDWRGNLELCDFVILNDLKHVFVDKYRHDIDWDSKFCGHEHGIQLAVGVIERKKPDPTLFSGWIFTGSFEFGFFGVLEEDGLF